MWSLEGSLLFIWAPLRSFIDNSIQDSVSQELSVIFDFPNLEIIKTLFFFHTPAEERLRCHHWHVKPQPTPQERVLQDKSAGLVGCLCNTQACHGTFGKWLLMDMEDDPPCWDKPQTFASSYAISWAKQIYQYMSRTFGIDVFFCCCCCQNTENLVAYFKYLLIFILFLKRLIVVSFLQDFGNTGKNIHGISERHFIILSV